MSAFTWSNDSRMICESFGWLARFFGTDARASNRFTRELPGWQPAHPGLLEDLDEGYYFRTMGG